MNRNSFEPNLLTESVVINCKSEEKAIDLLSYLNEKGFVWSSGDSLLNENYWDTHESNMCYRVTPNSIVNFSRKFYYEYNGYKIYEWELAKLVNRKNVDIEDLSKGEIAIWCNTEEKADDFLAYLESKGILWSSGDSPTNDNKWYVETKNTCYRIAGDGLRYDSMSQYIESGKEILEWEVLPLPSTINRYTLDVKNSMNTVINCDTKAKADDLLKYLHTLDLKWIDGTSLLDATCWANYEKDTCYDIEDGLVAYGRLPYYIDENIHVYEWEITEPISPSLELSREEDIEEVVLDGGRLFKSDQVNHPSHYTQYRVEVLDIIEDATKGIDGIEAVCLGNIIKYVLRYRFKNGVQDLKKARFYLDKLIATLDIGNE